MIGTINATLGSYPGLPFASAMARVQRDAHIAGCDHVQLCPQNHGVLDECIEALILMAPRTQFRLHANVRLEGHARQFDASSEGTDADAYFRSMALMSHRIGSTIYTLHAGARKGRPLNVLAARVRWLEQTFGHRVGVEGHYPSAGNHWWLSTWEEYAWLLESGLDYALDLSHLNIVARRSRRIEECLVQELLASERCVEVHVSGNDGYADQHLSLNNDAHYWWHEHLSVANPEAVVFYEGNEIRNMRP